jgi:anti-anti-sigma factor
MNEERPDLTVTVDERDPAMIRVAGEIDYSTSARLHEAVDEVLRTGTGGPLVFDLADVEFMDSSGLAVLVEAENRGAQVHVREASTAVELVIRATGLHHLLESES